VFHPKQGADGFSCLGKKYTQTNMRHLLSINEYGPQLFANIEEKSQRNEKSLSIL